MASTVQLQVEVVEKNAEARLKALDKLAKEMGNRKITLNFDEASLQRWKAATDGMTNAQLSAYAKLAAAAEAANAKMISAGQKSAQVEMQQNTKLITERQKSIDKKIQLWEKEDTKRRQISERTAQEEIRTQGKIQIATMKGVQGTRQQTQAQKELNTEAQKTGSIFSNITARFTAANLASSLITRGITLLRQALRQAVDEMKEMDKELTTIKMVTGASDSDINQMRDNAFIGARETGRSTSDYLSAAERFARAGYRENIQDLTKLSLVTQNVGGVTEDVASKFILAADAAWKMGGNTERLWTMLDGVTSIADQNATDIGKLAEAYTVAGSAFANAGESERTFAALIGTTTASTQRSGSEMARGLQTILFRVRQVKGELDDGEIINAEDISNAAKALDSVGISVLNDNKQLKSFTEIMGELAEIWPELNKNIDKYGIGARERLQNALAGNRRGNVLFSLMDNWDVFEKQLEQFDKGAGSALQKNEKYLDSWAASSENLKTSWTEIVSGITGNGQIIETFTKGIADTTHEIAQDMSPITGLIGKLANSKAAQKGASIIFGSIKDGIANALPGIKELKAILDVIGFVRDIIPEDSENGFIAVDAAAHHASDGLNNVSDSANNTKNEVYELATAFEQASERIKKASDGIKTDRDDAVKSIADIYKAMTNAADKKYFGSNAYREGAKLFFGTTSKDAIKEDARKALDAYFSEIEKGNYSRAAANLWGKIFNGNGKDGAKDILDKNGKIIASMKDLGGAFEWTFNRGDQSISGFLQSMETATGIGADFWASFIQSLGMYSDELDSWFEEKEIKTKVTVDTAEASNEIDGHIEHLGSIPGEVNTTVTTTYVTNGTPPSYPNGQSGSGNTSGSGGLPKRAKGKRDNFSGIAMVNDEFPADGSKPELIISKSTGRAFIANGGKPALVNLRSDDIVLTAKETRSALSVPTFVEGKYAGAGTAKAAALADETFGGGGSDDSVTTPDDPNPEKDGRKKKDKEKEAQEAWETLKKLIEYLMDKAEGELQDMLEALDQQLEALEAERKEQKQQKELEEKQLAVQQALVDLEKAQTERTVRYYNEETQQWEWMADQGEVEKAREALKNAEEDLKEYQDDLEYEAKRDAINQQKQDLQAQFDAYKENWEDIIDIIEAPSGDIQELLETIFGNASGTLLGEAQSIADLLNTLNAGFLSSGYELGLGRINDNTEDSTTTIDTIFGHQSAANTEDLLASIIGSVFGSGNMNDILGPTSKGGFAFNTEGLKAVTGGIENSLTYRNPSSTINNNGGNYYVNGVKIGADMAQKPFAEVMRTIAIHANETA